MSVPFQSQQLEFVLDVASHRTSFFDLIFRFLNYADTPYFAFLLIPLVWVGFSYRWGLRLFYLFLVNNLVNIYFKELFDWPRPCMTLPAVGMFCPTNPGFPSGAAQTCMLLGSLLIYSWKTRAAWVIGICYILLVSFSRIYLGVHYPIDILGGWTIGLALLGCYVLTIQPIEAFLKSKSFGFCLFLSIALPLLLIAFTTAWHYHRVDALAVGLGAFLSLKYRLYLPSPKTVAQGLIRGGIAVAVLFLILALFPHSLPISFRFAIISLWVSLGASPFCKAILRI